ncbi:MAG: hypothetical protein Q9208_004378 [Pyrenodesmia sp. 3 TL-2023]
MQDSLSLPEAKFLTGWSHGKEALKTGSFDSFKGSFYVNCDFFHSCDHRKDSRETYGQHPELTATNVWPPSEMLPGFRQCFEEICNLIIDTAILVARQCDLYALAEIEGYEPGYLERVVRLSTTTKARLLHYFPTKADQGCQTAPRENLSTAAEKNQDDWCATHIDHGCLTGLTSAVYIDESAHPPTLGKFSAPPPPLPFLPSAPDPESGLYIRSRTGAIAKINIPADCLGFQTGEALQLITGGKFQAVPHFVRAGSTPTDGKQVARNTLAVFTQPGLDEVVDRSTGKTFAQFSREVAGRFK